MHLFYSPCQCGFVHVWCVIDTHPPHVWCVIDSHPPTLTVTDREGVRDQVQESERKIETATDSTREREGGDARTQIHTHKRKRSQREGGRRGTDSQTDRQTHRQTDRRTDGRTGTQTDGQTDGRRDR